ncbi:MAG TPA: GDSL-type esterase/lipase family protein [Verrucomicrobiae bacterium]
MRLIALFAIMVGMAVGAGLSGAAPLKPADFPDAIRVACIGDSITAGVGAAPGQDYPGQLQRLLGANWKVANFGLSGRCLLRQSDQPYWRESTFNRALAFQPDIVVILLGANDSKTSNWEKFHDDFAGDYKDFVTAFRSLASGPRVYVCHPTPINAPTRWGHAETNVEEEIQIIDRLAKEMHLDVIDLHGLFEKTPQLLPDHLHPNSEGAGVMAQEIARAIAGDQPQTNQWTRLNSVFRPHAVFQRDVALPVWGTAASGQAVTVEFAGQSVTTVAKDGKWRVELQPLAASENPQTLTVRGGNTVTVDDILVGDVWLAGGQSNMEFKLGPQPGQKEVVGWKEAVAAANYPLIREFATTYRYSTEPLGDVRGRWIVCSPATAGEFTAVGFFFARDLQRVEHVPIGIVSSYWGGTPAEAWVDAKTLKHLPGFKDMTAVQMSYDNKHKQYLPSVLYNAMIAPLQAFPLKGIIWYQGEANNSRAREYRELFPLLIADWRHGWGEEDLPFLFVQIAPQNGMSPELREAQFLTLQKTRRTAMAVITDAGDATNIHPPRKEPVGVRLALAARAVAYGENIEYSGPLFESLQVEGSKAVVHFTHVGAGLVAQGGELKGFTIAGADKKFVSAKAEIVGDTVEVSSPEVATPVAVRYGWEHVPDVNLYNKEGLPASPFRSDVD